MQNDAATTRPISIRLTKDELSALTKRAGDAGMSAYIRKELFGSAPKRPLPRTPAHQTRDIAQLLALLGSGELADSLRELAHAARIGALPVLPETEAAINQACVAVLERDALRWARRCARTEERRMILKGSQRAGGSALAAHLLRNDENDHVTIHQVRGFVRNNLIDAFKEAFAISRGTKCKQFLFSLSLSPPPDETVPIDVFEAIDKIEARLGLIGQPRAIVFHEKNGRRHAHCVWSRIDAKSMRARQMGHFKLKLHELSREA